MHTKFWSNNLNGTDHSEDLGEDGSIILRWILGKTVVEDRVKYRDMVMLEFKLKFLLHTAEP